MNENSRKASSEAAKKHMEKLNYEQIKGDQKTKIDEGETYGAGIFNIIYGPW